MIPGIGPRAAMKLLERFGSAEAVFEQPRAELERLRLRPEAVESIVARDREQQAASELERVRALGADLLILDDGTYPALLREIPDPPIVLYVRGDWQACLNDPCVAVVGSRRCFNLRPECRDDASVRPILARHNGHLRPRARYRFGRAPGSA